MKNMIVWMIFGSLSCSVRFLMAVIYSFLTCDTDRQKQAVVTLTLYNSGWDRLAVTQFLTLCHPRLSLELDPYFGELLG